MELHNHHHHSADHRLTPEVVAQVPPPGLGGPSQISFSPGDSKIAYLHTITRKTNHHHHSSSNNKSSHTKHAYRPLTMDTPSGGSSKQHLNISGAVHTIPKQRQTTTERILMCFDVRTKQTSHLLHWASPNHKKRRSIDEGNLSLEERLRRERQRGNMNSLTTFSWINENRLLIPARGNLFVQEGIGDHCTAHCIHDKTSSNVIALDAQMAPNGKAVAWTADRNLYVQYATDHDDWSPACRLTDSENESISHGVADFVAQEEMDRYQGFWWHPDSSGILVCRNDESEVPVVRILHHNHSTVVASESGSSSQTTMDHNMTGNSNDNITTTSSNNVFEDHRYPFAGKMNPVIRLGWLPLPSADAFGEVPEIRFLEPPREANEYLARVHWVHESAAVAQWQNRSQTVTALQRITKTTCRTLLICRSDVWINLHHIFHVLEKPVHPKQVEQLSGGFIPRMPDPLPEGSFSFLFANERTGFQHVYLYTYCPGVNNEQAVELRAVTTGNWMVESITGVDQENNQIFFTGTYDSCLERHLYTTTLLGPPTPMHRLTLEAGMHSITMDSKCRLFVDTSSDIDRPTTVKIYQIQNTHSAQLVHTLYNAATDEDSELISCLKPPQLIHFPTADGTETLYAAVFAPDSREHGPGPYPLVCAVYGGPHVQRVNRSWSQSADLRAQRLRSLGFCVVKCDNRGSSRRGLAFESSISKRLGRLEVLDQVSAVRQLIMRGLVDASRVGVYGWSYGGYLAAMCLCRAPDVFHVAVAGAPVTSWDGYDTHYTERYMGLPADNPSGYRESAVFDHVPNLRGNLMIVHGLIDENVHFRHTSRLINKLIAAGKEYDLLIFPEERHSPRRLRDRIYMEQRISDYFFKHLVRQAPATALDLMTASLNGQSNGPDKNGNSLRPMAGHL